MGWINDSIGALWRFGGFMRKQANTPGPADNFWYNPVGGQTQSGVRVTPDIALRASAVYAVVKVLAETMATMPLRMFRDLGDQGRVPEPNHPLDDIIRFQPNDWQTAVEFWEVMVANAVLRGNAYAEILPGPRGAVDQLIPLHPDAVTVQRLPNRVLRFKVRDIKTGKIRILLPEEIFRIPGLSSDAVTGLNVVDLAAEDIGLSMAADAYASRIFSNSINTEGVITHPGTMTPEGQTNFLTALTQRMSGGAQNSHRPLLLQEGMTYKRITDTAKESQLLEARKWQVTLIAQRWRVPLHMLGIDDQTNRSTVEAQAIEFVKYTLRPWARRIEQAIRRDLIIAKGTFSAKYNMDALLRGDSAARAGYLSAALGAGGHSAWITVNEARVIEGLNPVEGGDELREPGNMQGQPVALDVPAITDQSEQARIERLVQKEAGAMRRAVMRFAGDPDGFQEWVGAFFGGHASAVMDLLDVPKETARAYCEHVKAEVLAINDSDGLLHRWENGRAQEIAEILAARR